MSVPHFHPRPRFLYALAVISYACFGTVFQIFPPFLDDPQDEFGLGRTLASLTMTAFLAPLVLVSPLLGAAVDHHGPAHVGRIGFAVLLPGSAGPPSTV